MVTAQACAVYGGTLYRAFAPRASSSHTCADLPSQGLAAETDVWGWGLPPPYPPCPATARLMELAGERQPGFLLPVLCPPGAACSPSLVP